MLTYSSRVCDCLGFLILLCLHQFMHMIAQLVIALRSHLRIVSPAINIIVSSLAVVRIWVKVAVVYLRRHVDSQRNLGLKLL